MTKWQSVDELYDLVSDLSRFTQEITGLACRIGLDIAPLMADHISLRCHQNATAERWSAGLEKCGTLFSESLINGRPVRLFKLEQPVCVAHWNFTLIELPWPGEKRYPHEGWEHIEIVLPGPAEGLHARALALLGNDGLLDTGIKVKTSSPAAEGETLPNPTLAITDGKVTLKFHPWSIEAVVLSERQPVLNTVLLNK
ncbi:VOC family protein [Citrobacter sp. JGM124]|uniref:VOC family protein n=1 Tax=Citrobacter sp. JGM124 TaxID=2799789 RepID=UPI001BA6AFD4|nr:VOC family protein [Citrobacter sp. JGM124]MBS0846993.1 VOC family protein [Citrobacter sp. JGM124]